MSAIVIECYNEKNKDVMFQPTSELYRGHWSTSKIPNQEMRPAIRAMPEIPGIHIAVDVSGRVCRAYDPLESDKSTWDRIKSVIDANPMQFNAMRPWPEVRHEDCSDNVIKTWLWWMRRLCDAKNARLKSGTLPTYEEILAMPGSAFVGQLNNVVSRKLTADKDCTIGQQIADKRGVQRQEKAQEKATSKG